MNKTLKWILIGLAIAVGAFLIALPVFGMVLGGARYGISHMGRFGSGMMLPFGGFFRLFAGIIPLGVLALAVVGVVLLVRNNRAKNVPMVPPAQPAQPTELPAAPRVCIKCSRILQAEGEFCPYCGEKQ